MRRALAALIALCFWLSPGTLAQPLPVDKGHLASGISVTDEILSSEPHRYRLALSENNAFTITMALQPANAAIYATILDNSGQLLEPADRSFRDNTFSQVYGECPAPPCSLLLDGAGTYTLTSFAGNTLHPAEEVLNSGDTVNGILADGQSRAYWLETNTANIITVTLIGDRQPVYARLIDKTGHTQHPVFEHYDGIKGSRAQVYYVTDPGSVFNLLISGSGKYTLQIEAGDTIRVDSGTLVPGEIRTETKPASGYASFALIDLTGDDISVAYADGARDVFLHDADGQRIFASTIFLDYTSLQRIAVFKLSGNAPYLLSVQAENSYTVSLTAGDVSLVDGEVLQTNTVTASDIPGGMTPVFSLDAIDESAIMYLIFSEQTVLTSLDLQFRAADKSLVEPTKIILTRDGLRIEGIPGDACPCQFIPHISGKFAISIAAEMPDINIPIQLLQAEVNLRAGANIRAPIIAIGSKDQRLNAFARSEDNEWLLAVTDSRLIVWVFRQLTAPLDNASLDTLPVTGVIDFVEPVEITADPSPSETATVTVTASPETGAATPGNPLPSTTAAAGFSCVITSGGGINMRQGAGMEYPIVGSLTDGNTTSVTAQSYDSDSNIWWQLENGGWVRADVVVEIGDCQNAPAQKPASR